MLKWLKNRLNQKFVAVQEREMRDWIAKLRALDSSEVATILAIAMHYRNIALAKTGVDLMLPFVAIISDPTIGIKLNQDVQGLQSRKLFSLASGAIVWLFTVRAAQNPELHGNWDGRCGVS